MDASIAQSSSREEQVPAGDRAPMSATLLWLASLPVSLPTYLLYAAWSKVWDALRRSLTAPVFGSAETQTELNMHQLDNYMVILSENENAVCDHRALLELARKENSGLRTELEVVLARLALLNQHNADLEQYNQRLFSHLREAVLPVFELLMQSAKAADEHDITAEVLEALHCTKQLLAEPEGPYCGTAEVSPAEAKPNEVVLKPSPRGDALVQLALLPTLALHCAARGGNGSPLESRDHGFLSARQSHNTSQGIAKVLSFGSPPSRSTAVLHILAHDI